MLAVFVLSAVGTSAIAATKSAQDFQQAQVNSGPPVTKTLTFSFTGLTAAPNLKLAYGVDFAAGSPSCTTPANCTLSVSFAPKSPGLREDAVLATDAASGALLSTVYLHGIGLGPQVSFHPGVITTFAGGTSSSTTFFFPQGVTVDPLGNVYVADSANEVVRKISADGTNVTSVAGNGTWGYSGDGGKAVDAQLQTPVAVALDGAGNVYIADKDNNCIREVDAVTQHITTLAGKSTGANLSGPNDVAVDGSGNVYIADSYNGAVEKLDTSGTLTVIAGGGGTAPGAGLLDNPSGIAVDPLGDVYIANSGHHVIQVLSAGVLTPVAGTADAQGYAGDQGLATKAELSSPVGIRLDAAGDLYIADFGNNRVREVLAGSGIITTVAGSGTPGYSGDNGSPTAAELWNPMSIALDAAGNLFISDSTNDLIRKVSFGLQPFSFGTVSVGLASTPQMQGVFNVGNAALGMSGLRIGSNFQQQASGFMDCSASVTLSGGQGCMLAIAFAPTANGSLLSSVALTDNSLNAAGSVQTAVLSGTGTGGAVPQLTLSSTNLSFANQTTGTVSAAQTVTLKNTGTADLHISGMALSGANAADFALSGTCATPLTAGASCTLSITFAPTAVGTRSAALVINDELASSPQTVALSGTAIASYGQSGQGYATLSIPQNTSIQIGAASAQLSLKMQSDGNLVLYQAGIAVWSSGTWGQNCGVNQCRAMFQSDGNFVVYNGSTPLWYTGTWGHSGAQLVLSTQLPYMQIIGQDQSILWANSYVFSAGNLVLQQGASLNLGSLSLTMQSDGNLVLYQSGVPVWFTGTWGQNCGANQCRATFQSDGNFVVYNGSTPLWWSGTWGSSGAQLVLSNRRPYLEIITQNQFVLWQNP